MVYLHGTSAESTTGHCVIQEWTLRACSGDFEISFEDASPTCGMACLVGGCVCGIPYYSPSLTLTSHTFSPRHTLTDWPPVLLLLAHLLALAKRHTCCSPILVLMPKHLPRTVSVVKIFSRQGARTAPLGAGREGDETQLGSCVDCQRTNGPQTRLIPMDSQ